MLGFGCGDNRYDALVATSLAELNGSVDKCVERVVLTHSHICSGIVLGAALANDDVACDTLLTAENLNA